MRETLSYSSVMPPTIFIFSTIIAGLICLVWRRAGALIALASGCCLYLFAMPIVPELLQQEFLPMPSRNFALADAQAIVVPCVDVTWGNGADHPNEIGPLTLQRLATAVRLYRRLQLPIIVSGAGSSKHPGATLATLMRDELEHDFSTPVQYVEDEAHNTFEHAVYTSRILRKKGIRNVIVTSNVRDAPRLIWSFRKVGLDAISSDESKELRHFEAQDFLPSANAFLESYYVIHEILGSIYYRFAY